MKLNWRKLSSLHKNLVKDRGFGDNQDIKFILVTRDEKLVEKKIKFKSLLPFMWELDQSPKYKNFLITDAVGNVLYKHRRINGDEEIPYGGNISVITEWNKYSQSKKDIFVEILASQIYEKHSKR
jgi:hypothetical protein